MFLPMNKASQGAAKGRGGGAQGPRWRGEDGETDGEHSRTMSADLGRRRTITWCCRAGVLIRKTDKRQNHHLVLQGRGSLISDTFAIRHFDNL